MDQWGLVVVLVVAVVAAWDFGRRLTQKTSAQRVDEEINQIKMTLVDHNHRTSRVQSEVGACERKLLELDTKLRGLSSKQESQAAVSRPRGGFPRIG